MTSQYFKVGREIGKKMRMNWRCIVVKKWWHGGERVKKVGKTSDVIYVWPKPHPPSDYFDHYTMGYNSFWCVIPFSTYLCIYGFGEIFPSLDLFYTNLHELFCQFISWTNWVNSGKFMDNCWKSCQVMADMKKVYDDLIIIKL